jgi:osmoprotectant transport system substrate-binding protein
MATSKRVMRMQRCRRSSIPSAPTRLVVAVVSVALCLGSSAASARAASSRRAVVVASFDFVESAVLARIYADALREVGIPVRLELNLGPRELVQPAMRQGLVDVVPEYLGTALEASAPRAVVDRHDTAAVHAQLAEVMGRWQLYVLTPADAQNQNTFVVTRRAADDRGLHTVSDLRRWPRGVVVGGPPECPQRPYCLVGLRDVYGVRVRRFVPLEGQAQTLAALEQGVVDVAVMFTTDGALGSSDVVALSDDRELQPVENVVPVVSAPALGRYGARLVGALDAVSARLTTGSLRFLNWRTTFGGNSAAAEARGWLERRGLVTGGR